MYIQPLRHVSCWKFAKLSSGLATMLFSHCDLAVKPSHSTNTFKLASLFLLGVVIVEELNLLTDMSQYTRDDIILILERWHLWEFAPVEPTTIVHKTISSSVLVYLLEHYVKHKKSIALLNDNHEGNVHYLFCLICPFAFHWINMFEEQNFTTVCGLSIMMGHKL